MFQIEFIPEAVEDLQSFRAYEQRQILQAIEAQLFYPRRGIRSMKTITIQDDSAIHLVLEQANDEDVIIQLADGRQFIVSAIADFDVEIAQTRRNETLMSFLDERAKQTQTIPLDQVKRQLGLV
jgi:hypothetical protein